MKVQDRFLHYITIPTSSIEENLSCPSNPDELKLAEYLADELRGMGLKSVTLTESSYLYAHLPASEGCTRLPSIGFIAHLDTSPSFNGNDIKPQIIYNYSGVDILLKGAKDYIKVSDFPDLKEMVNKTVITSDGTSLLGSDDKAGIAEIMTALEQIITEQLPHGHIYVAFTPDEELGRGCDKFEKDYFPVDFAFTVDGDYEAEVAYENFNAASAKFEIKGREVHPGEAKGIMVNASLIAAELISLLPAHERPENTEGRQGFFHVCDIKGDVSHAEVNLIVRDHDKKLFNKKIDLLRTLERKLKLKYSEDTVELTVTDSYYNMLDVMQDHMDIITLANQAIAKTGLAPISRPVRGGTDGAQLSFMGIPCPNLGTGGYGFHGPYEHVCVESMETVVNVIKNIVSSAK